MRSFFFFFSFLGGSLAHQALNKVLNTDLYDALVGMYGDVGSLGKVGVFWERMEARIEENNCGQKAWEGDGVKG